MRGFFAMLSRMKYIDRWGLMRCTRNETLSEHTLETAMLTHALIAIANERFGEQLDAGEGVLYALYHDAPEIVTGDLPTPVKYHDEQIRGAYRAIEEQATEQLLSLLPDSLRGSFAPYFEEGNAYTPYVKAADKLSALIKCIEESRAGNREFDEAKRAALAHPSLSLPAARVFLEEFLPAYSLTLDEVGKFE
jgi:5'-deoxynucleotidase